MAHTFSWGITGCETCHHKIIKCTVYDQYINYQWSHCLKVKNIFCLCYCERNAITKWSHKSVRSCYEPEICSLQKSSIIEETAGTTWSILTHFFGDEMCPYACVKCFPYKSTYLSCSLWGIYLFMFSAALSSSSECARSSRKASH